MYLRLEQLYTTRLNSELQCLSQIPAIQRRRLSALAKLALNSAVQALQTHQVDYIVWVSCFGDEQKTIGILQDILQGHAPSPTQFSTSVHNAIAGLYSILFQDATPSTSLSAGWADAMLEAYAFLKTQPNLGKALVVYYDAPLPDMYKEGHDFEAFSMAAVVALDAPNLIMDLQLASKRSHCVAAKDALEFLAFWQSEQMQDVLGMWQRC
ncbi:beta-ketoacyl synthase chain length factor [Acinetobacter sp. MD2]|uniref:beta-ketoacyl synthase chain length factor n=1 Tax=Acinetobacter sp. MD2 TaxID=2600066 RepID=UPI002D1E556A|nr:beta-ketoacyl synthase chain length factor [Acinetobacter sp. MD2]MEB3767071.1 beta-ketoacyl synthase chain length factor [Acinetobacter sp. MD2]